jgi:hypothetical protein
MEENPYEPPKVECRLTPGVSWWTVAAWIGVGIAVAVKLADRLFPAALSPKASFKRGHYPE